MRLARSSAWVWRPASCSSRTMSGSAGAGVVLADEGCQAVEAGVGEEALGRSLTVDVILLNLVLLGVGGLAICRTLRSRGDLPIISITARLDTTDVISGLEVEADDYVTKPLAGSEPAAHISELYCAVARPVDSTLLLLEGGV